MPFLAILISIIIWGFLFWLAWWGLGKLALGEPFTKLATVVLVIAAIVVVLGILTGATWAIFPIVSQLMVK
jgi:hypothetical protein